MKAPIESGPIIKASDWMLSLDPKSKNKLQTRAEVAGFCGDKYVAERLREMGFLSGEWVEYKGRAPFSGPFLLRMGTVVLALRESEAQCLLVKRLD